MSEVPIFEPISRSVPPEMLITVGITMGVRIAPLDDLTREFNILAEIDTGADTTSISLELGDKLAAGLSPSGEGTVFHAQDSARKKTKFFWCQLTLLNGRRFNLEVAVMARSFEPHDVLIGRDILSECRLEVDYPAGEWTLTVLR